jgi:hemerythrin
MMVFNDYPLVELPFMNEEHEEFVQLVNAVEQDLLDGKSALASFSSLVEHVYAHFAHEEKAMLAASFPPYPMHKHEHERVLDLLDNTLAQYRKSADGSVLLPFIVEELPAWFSQHLTTMDRVTARFLTAGID